MLPALLQQNILKTEMSVLQLKILRICQAKYTLSITEGSYYNYYVHCLGVGIAALF
jgi:hypothetical protein